MARGANGSKRAGGVSIRASDDCEGCRSAAWSRGEACLRVPSDRKGCRSTVSSGSEGCRSVASSRRKGSRSAPPATAQVFDPRHGAGRKCSIRAPHCRASVRSAWPATAQVFDPLVRQVFDPVPGASRRVSSPRLRRLRRVSIRRHPVAGSVRSAPPCIRASVRSTVCSGPNLFDRCGVERTSGRSRCSIRVPGGRASVRSTRPARRASVRSAAWKRPDLFDPRPRRPRKCSIQGPAERVGVRSAGLERLGIDRESTGGALYAAD